MLQKQSHFLIPSSREIYRWWQMRVCCQVGLSEARVPYCLPVKPSLTKMMLWRWDWTHSPDALSTSWFCFSVGSVVFAAWERNMRNCVYEVWTGNQKQESCGELVSCGCLDKGGLCNAVTLVQVEVLKLLHKGGFTPRAS